MQLLLLDADRRKAIEGLKKWRNFLRVESHTVANSPVTRTTVAEV